MATEDDLPTEKTESSAHGKRRERKEREKQEKQDSVFVARVSNNELLETTHTQIEMHTATRTTKFACECAVTFPIMLLLLALPTKASILCLDSLL
jgi:hypothetical protein